MGRHASLITLALLLSIGCDARNAEIIGTVRNIDDSTAVVGAAVGFGQTINGKFTVRPEYTATTGAAGGYLLHNEFGSFPEGFVTFSHDDYEPDTVEFYGASVGKRERVDVNLVFIDTVVIVLTSELFGTVVDAADSTLLIGVDVGLSQMVADTLRVMSLFSTSTSIQGTYIMRYDDEDIPSGFLLFSRENYVTDTVTFAGVTRGNSAQVNVSLSKIDTTSGGAPRRPDSYNH